MASPFKKRSRNFFLSKSISRETMKQLVGDHLDALEADEQPAGAPDTKAMAAKLRPLYEQFQVGLGTGKAGLAARGNQTTSVGEAFEALKSYPAEIARVHILPKHDEKSAVYKEFFPKGRTAFSGASQKAIGTDIRAFILTARKYAELVPAAVVTELQTRLKTFEDAGTEQGKAEKINKDGRQAIGKDQKALAVHLFANFGAFIHAFAAEPEKAELYFNLGALPAKQQKKKATTTAG
ncbi:hypothetical protein EJV47_23465 [Hymenobacter gummosus]|uniref:Uncharacterized protein n=1 Tax=Hymenobacter gummosus TaxID=1776032 RepID=A0A431TWD3_9BACT|nr:hypothetical protein [Hymenobacter gummosus]RTQ45798.1 hypothetical protein EJV47_23465 [Hymenobacter gummosus]